MLGSAIVGAVLLGIAIVMHWFNAARKLQPWVFFGSGAMFIGTGVAFGDWLIGIISGTLGGLTSPLGLTAGVLAFVLVAAMATMTVLFLNWKNSRYQRKILFAAVVFLTPGALAAFAGPTIVRILTTAQQAVNDATASIGILG